MSIEIKIVVDNVAELHETCNLIINGYDFADNGPVVIDEESPALHTHESVAQEALKYKTRNEFNKVSPSAYQYARKNCLLDEICEHMKLTQIANQLASVEIPVVPSPEEAFKQTPETPEPSSDRDPHGVPWDVRIHTSKKTRNADGAWKLKKKPKEYDAASWKTYVATVKAELIGLPPEAPVAPVAPEGKTFPDLMLLITSNLPLGKFTVEDVNNICINHGVMKLSELSQGHDDLIPAVYAEIEALTL